MMLSTSEMTTEKIPVKLPNGAIIKIEVSDFGREDVASNVMNFDDIAPALEGITAAIKGTIEKVKPKKASVKFGLETSIESGKLTAVIVKGSGKANLEITLEWSE
jgi:Trypsin-co-occurring domain 1